MATLTFGQILTRIAIDEVNYASQADMNTCTDLNNYGVFICILLKQNDCSVTINFRSASVSISLKFNCKINK